MIWKKHTRTPLERIARTGFLVSLASYFVFWMADLVEPGFVSRYFSVHIFLLTMLMFGVAWATVLEQYTERHWIHSVVVLVLGVVLAVLTWNLTRDLVLYRVPLALISFLTPTIIYALIRS